MTTLGERGISICSLESVHQVFLLLLRQLWGMVMVSTLML